MQDMFVEPAVNRNLAIRLWIGATVTYMVLPPLLVHWVPNAIAETIGVVAFLALSDRSLTMVHAPKGFDHALVRFARAFPYQMSGAAVAIAGRYLLLPHVFQPLSR